MKQIASNPCEEAKIVFNLVLHNDGHFPFCLDPRNNLKANTFRRVITIIRKMKLCSTYFGCRIEMQKEKENYTLTPVTNNTLYLFHNLECPSQLT